MTSVTEDMAALSMSDEVVDKKVALIKENIQEVIGEEKMREILKKRDQSNFFSSLLSCGLWKSRLVNDTEQR